MKEISMDVILKGKKHPETITSDGKLTDRDWAEIREANKTIKYLGKQMKYLTKDSDEKWATWENRPSLIIPIERTEPEYWEAKGDFEIISEAEALKLIQKIPVRIELD